MKIDFTVQAAKEYKKLPVIIQKKAQNKLHLLIDNYRHPSIQTRKMRGTDKFEGRIDIHYRFTFIIEGETIVLLSIGMHDAGLGKK